MVSQDIELTPHRGATVYVVLLNWNNASDTIACLKSLEKLAHTDFRVIVADNASRDDSYTQIANYIREASSAAGTGFVELQADDACSYVLHQSVKHVLLQTGSNLGFAGGNNMAVRLAMIQEDMRYIWLLNNDTEVDPLSLQELVLAYERFPETGICGSKLVYFDDRSKLQALGGRYNRWLATSSHVHGHDDPSGTYDEIKISASIDYVVGASMLVSRSFLERVGLMSEDYFLYYEEIDWATRARRAGYKLHIAISSIVFHKEGASINAGSTRRSEISERCYLKNRLVITRKFFPLYLPIVWATGLLIALRRILRRDIRGFKIALSVLFEA